jgi:hypothetical protein
LVECLPFNENSVCEFPKAICWVPGNHYSVLLFKRESHDYGSWGTAIMSQNDMRYAGPPPTPADTAIEFAIGAVLLIAIGSLIVRFVGWV